MTEIQIFVCVCVYMYVCVCMCMCVCEHGLPIHVTHNYLLAYHFLGVCWKKAQCLSFMDRQNQLTSNTKNTR
jgi:hypothetical protein